jgi:SNF2 family DNA or RNA helicase
MKLPSLQELKRSGQDALKKGLDPSALERGLQYLRDQGFLSLEVSVLGSKGFLIEFVFTEKSKTKIEMTTPSQPLFSECDCSMAGYGIFCKHQACATWVITALASQRYEFTRVEDTVYEHLKGFEPAMLLLKTTPVAAPTVTSYSHDPESSTVNGMPQYSNQAVTLEGLIFCFPNQPIQSGHAVLELETKLSTPRSHEGALLPDLALPFYRESDLPHPLWRSPVSFRGTTNNLFQNPFEVARRKSVYFLFSDNTRIPISELLYHKNANVVPSELLPVASNLNEAFLEKKRARFFPKSKEVSVWDLRADDRLDAILLSVADAASKLLRREKLKVYFSFQETLDAENKVLVIEKLDLTLPVGLKSGYQIQSTATEAASLQCEINLGLHPEWHWFQTFALNQDAKELFFHSLNRWLENYPPALTIETHGQFEIIFNRMQDEFHASFNEIHAYPPFQFLKNDSFTPHLRVFSNGTFSVELNFDFGAIDGIPFEILKQIKVLTLGIRAWDENFSEELFAAKKQAKRANDLRLLRHIGVSALILQESVRYFIRKDRTFDAFLEYLKTKLAHLINKLEGAPHSHNLSLEVFCSKAAIEYLEKYILSLKTLFEEKLFPLVLKEQNVLVSGVYAFYLKLLYAWVTLSQNQSQGAVLLKTKDGIIQNANFENPETMKDIQFFASEAIEASRTQSLRYVLSKKEQTPENLIRAFLPLQNEGAQVSLDDQSIEELHDEDFISEFVLEEQPDQHGRIDWFELHPKFFFKGTEISEESAKKLSETGMITFQGKIYRLNSGSIPSLEKLTHFWDQLAGASGPKRGNKKTDRIYKLPKHYTLELLALRATGVKVKGGPIWDKIVNFYETLNEERPPLELPKGFAGELKPYQHRGVQWVNDLYQLGLGGILADDMGLGKTVQTLVFLEMLRTKKELGHALIVVPTSLTYNWFSEAKKFTSELPMHIFQSKELSKAKEFLEQNPDGVLISTYGLLAEHEVFFSNTRWNIHIYDEAQNLKTITAKRTTVSRKIPARFKLCLTGTPLENHMGEFFSLMDLVVPGSLGPFDQFRKTYMQSYAPEPDRIQYLKSKTRPLVLRRTKSAILKELPPKTESTVKIPFTEKQLAIYRDIALSWNSRVRAAISEGGESKSQLIMLTALLRLRQVCSAPSAIPNVNYTETPPKLTLLTDNLKSIIETGESALVFTQFLGTFDLIAKELTAAGIPFFTLHGKVSRKDRDIQLQKFQEHKAGAVMLMTLKTGGVGLNLTKASYVFHLEPWWNPAVENQATDRTHRIGQTKPVQVYRYIMSESVEEKIEVLKSRKSSQFNALFSDVETTQELGEGGSFTLSQNDFEYLLGI